MARVFCVGRHTDFPRNKNRCLNRERGIRKLTDTPTLKFGEPRAMWSSEEDRMMAFTEYSWVTPTCTSPRGAKELSVRTEISILLGQPRQLGNRLKPILVCTNSFEKKTLEHTMLRDLAWKITPSSLNCFDAARAASMSCLRFSLSLLQPKRLAASKKSAKRFRSYLVQLAISVSNCSTYSSLMPSYPIL